MNEDFQAGYGARMARISDPYLPPIDCGQVSQAFIEGYNQALADTVRAQVPAFIKLLENKKDHGFDR